MNTLEFKKYNSIENTYDKEFMEKIKMEIPDSMQFVVQEKVHGANCCFVTDGDTTRFAKRTSLVEVGELFYDYEKLLEKHRAQMLDMFQRVKEKYPEAGSVLIYGEMFGGKYPHPDVKNDSKVMNIQKGVFYSPVHEFYGYYIYVSASETGKFLSVDEINDLFEQEKFLYAKTLFRGNLDECLKYPNDFQSCVANWLGLPALDDNICEGIVIRPVEPVYLRNGARVLLKSKNSKFAEKKSVKKRQPRVFVEPTYSETLNDQLTVVEEYITENRLNNVVSKIGHISIPKEMGKLIGLFSKDILEDYLKEYSGSYALLEKNEQKILNCHANKQAIDLIKEVYMNQRS